METETDVAAAQPSIPIVCTLTGDEATGRLLKWADLQHHAMDVVAFDRGVRMTFPAMMFDDVELLARRERTCCAFLAISTSLVGEVLTLDIRSESPEALPVIWALAGIALR